MYTFLVTLKPPATVRAPGPVVEESVVFVIDTVVSKRVVAPPPTHNAYALVMVSLVPAVGAPAMNNVAALVVVTEVLLAASVGTPIQDAYQLVNVPEAAVPESVKVLA